MSVLVHVLFAQGVAPGPPGRFGDVASSRTITASLVAPAAPPADAPPAEPALPAEPVQPQPRAQRTHSPSTEPVQIAKSERDPGSSTGIAAAPDATYYAARELDVYPALAAPLDLRPISHAGRADNHGGALLLVLIDAQGAVDEVSIVEPGARGIFEDDARRAFLAARFTPALKNGRAVKSRLLIRIEQGAESAAQ